MPDHRSPITAHDRELLVLAALAEQARLQGVTVATLEALIARASEEGARRALRRIGLADAHAGADIHELRTLLEAWRAIRRTARETAIRWLVTMLLCALAAGLALRFKLWPPG